MPVFDFLVVKSEPSDEWQRVLKALEDMSFSACSYSIPSIYELEDRLYGINGKNSPTIVHGPILPTTYLQNKYGFAAFTSFEKTKCSFYYPYFGKHLLQSKYCMLPLGDLKRQWDWLYEMLGVADHLFVRPDDNTKSFTAKCMGKEDIVYLERSGVAPDTIVIVSRPQRVLAEYRVFMQRGNYLTGSLYKVDGQLIKVDNVPSKVIEFAELVAQDRYKELPKVWVLDICEDGANELKVLEVAGASCAGMYEADCRKILKAMWDEVQIEYSTSK